MDVSNINTITNLQNQLNSLTLDCVNKINLSKNSLNTEKLLLQIELTLQEGGGECIYEFYDDKIINQIDLQETLKSLEKLLLNIDSTIEILRMHFIEKILVAEVLIRKNNNNYVELKVGLFGDEQSGKTTLVGVLKSGQLDNGIGLAREAVFRYPHEIQTGRTTSICHQVLSVNIDSRF